MRIFTAVLQRFLVYFVFPTKIFDRQTIGQMDGEKSENRKKKNTSF